MGELPPTASEWPSTCCKDTKTESAESMLQEEEMEQGQEAEKQA